jgi:hypothetical protein
MNQVIPIPVARDDHQDWFPVLELATREFLKGCSGPNSVLPSRGLQLPST